MLRGRRRGAGPGAAVGAGYAPAGGPGRRAGGRAATPGTLMPPDVGCWMLDVGCWIGDGRPPPRRPAVVVSYPPTPRRGFWIGDGRPPDPRPRFRRRRLLPLTPDPRLPTPRLAPAAQLAGQTDQAHP